jgi:hypothetical protein
MEKNWCRALAVVSLLLFVPFIMPAYAEDYVSTNVPPDDVVLRMINAEITGSEPTSAQLLGKLALYQHSCYQPQSSYISLQASWICCCQVTEDCTFTDLQGLRNFYTVQPRLRSMRAR